MPALLLAFGLSLLAAVLLSSLAHRTVLSSAVLFLVVGMVLASEPVGVLHFSPRDPLVAGLAELALFSTLFTDGLRIGLPSLRQAWRLPGRALTIGLPLTFLGTTLLAHLVAGLPWVPSLLLGAVLSPTDPVFASAIVGREEIPFPLRNLLNVESGINDGLTLPLVIVLLAVAGAQSVDWPRLGVEVAGGLAIGVVVPTLAVGLARLPMLSATARYEPLNALAIGLIVLALAHVTHANVFLAGFAAGVTVATVSPTVNRAFGPLGEQLSELFKLGALLVFGALISPAFLGSIGPAGYLFALAALVLARPAALAAALAGSGLPWREQVAAAWFGPKGFASVLYAIMVLEARSASGDHVFHLAALVVTASIVAHSSTDVLVARWLDQGTVSEDQRATPAERNDPTSTATR